jgi:DNA-binding transcriptional MerR regulator
MHPGRIDFENSKRLFYSIKEVANHFGVNESLLRYWENEFKIINPNKTEGGTRQYTKEDIDNIALVFHLVKEKGMTLDGARLALSQRQDEYSRKLQAVEKLEHIKKELEDMKKQFDVLDD